MSPENEPRPTFEISAMTPDDIEEATMMRLDLWFDTYENEEAGVTREWIAKHNMAQITPEKNKLREERLQNSSFNAGWVAKDSSGNIIGSTTPYIDGDGRQDVGSMYVKKNWHGKGVATALMQKAIDWFEPALPIELSVASYNERAKAFYRKWGFEEIPNSETLFADKIPNIIMVRKGDSK